MKSGVFIIFVSLILVLSVSFVSAGIFCDVFGINCESDLKGELFQSGPGTANCEDYSLRVVSDKNTKVGEPSTNPNNNNPVNIITREYPATWGAGYAPVGGSKWINHPTKTGKYNKYSYYSYERTFNVEDGHENYMAELEIAADNEYVAYLNGDEVGSGSEYRIKTKHDISNSLKVGENKLRIRVYNHKHGSALTYAVRINAECVQDEDISITCTDSDGGLEYYERGSVNGLEVPGITDTWTDYCGTSGDEEGNLVEYNCRADNYGVKNIYECPFVCGDGACKEDPGFDCDLIEGPNYIRALTLIQFAAPDSTIEEQKGNTPLTVSQIRANVARMFPNFEVNGNDVQSYRDGVLMELVATGYNNEYIYNQRGVSTLSAVEIRENARDVINNACEILEGIDNDVPQETCIDSDGGKDYYEKGGASFYVEGNRIEVEDACGVNGYGPDVLEEWYCESATEQEASHYTCPNGCTEGACKVDPCAAIDCAPGHYCSEGVCIGGIKSCEDEGDYCVPITDCASTSANDDYFCPQSSQVCCSNENGLPDYVILRDFGVIKTSGDFEKGVNADQVDLISELFNGFLDGESTRYTIENAAYDQDMALVVAEFEKDISFETFEEKIVRDLKSNGYDLDYDPGQVYDYTENPEILFYSGPGREDMTATWISKNILVSIYFEDFRSLDRIHEDDFHNILLAYQDKFPSSIDFEDEIPTHQVCLPLIEEATAPFDIIDNGNAYELSHSGTYGNRWYVDNEVEEYTTHYASYRALNNDDFDGSINIYQEVSVFDNLEVDAVKVVEEQTSGTVCIKDNYWGRDNTDNGVYICNWNALKEKQDSGNNNQHYSREIYWAYNNVMVRVNINFGKYLSEEEIAKLGQENLINLLGKLKNNKYEYVSWDNFDIPQQARNFIERSLSQCNSEIKFDDNTCNPSWQCKTEPLICPPHGEQTRTCYDSSCNSQDQVSISSCSPGICSGCYVSKWYDSKDNKCIPYGFRFEQEGEERVELVERTDRENIPERSGNQNEGYILEILSDTEAFFSYIDLNYTLIEGKTIRVVADGKESEEYFDLEIIDVVQATNSSDGYVDMIITSQQERTVREQIPSYCEIDGKVNVQKTKDRDGSWASCQNNYECESNVCSNGECVDTASAIRQAGALRAFFIKVVCRISTLAGDDYGECLAEAGL